VEKTESELRKMVRDGLMKTNNEFADLENISGREYIKVTKLPSGAFARYIEEQRQAGADLAQMKPNHIQASEKVMNRLISKG
jgi:hypothetical protein